MITTVVSYDGNTFGTNYNVDFFSSTQPRLPAAQIQTLELVGAYPVITALTCKPNRLALLITINDIANVDTLRAALFRIFDPKDKTPKVLVVNSTGSVPQYVYAQCEEFVPYSTPRHEQAFAATLVVHGDAKWRAVTGDTDTWNITASGQSKTLTNNGEDDAYPVFNIKPTAAKTGGYIYKRWTPILWVSDNPGPQYPCVATLNTSTPIGAGKMQADGDDLRVFSDGVEISRWRDAVSWNGASSKVWFNLSFSPSQSGTLKTALDDSTTPTALELNEDLTAWPSAGIVLIENEALVFTNKDVSRSLLSGITRACKGTTMATHAIGVAVYWIQHDVWIVYGNSTVGAPVVNNAYKPAFELDHSTNGSWVYETFGLIAQGDRRILGEYQSGRWVHQGNITVAGMVKGVYTATQRTCVASGNLFTVMGAWIDVTGVAAVGWILYHPCGITNVAWSNGLKRKTNTGPKPAPTYGGVTQYLVNPGSYWETQYVIPEPGVLGAWESWSYSGAAFASARMVALFLSQSMGEVEVGDVTVTLDAASIPTVTVNAEQSTTTLAVTLANSTTGESLTVAFECDLNQTLQIDTCAHTVTYLKDNSLRMSAVTPLPVRTQWLKLSPGANTIVYTDAGTNAVTLTTTWAKRFF